MTTRITEEEIAELERLSEYLPRWSQAWPIELVDGIRKHLPGLLSERREREGRLAEYDRTMRDYQIEGDQSVHDIVGRVLVSALREKRRAEAAEAALARVSELHTREQTSTGGQVLCNACGHIVPCPTMRALTTPVVSSDRLTPGDRSYVEDARRRKRSDLGAAAAFNLIDIIDRLAPSVSHQEDKGNE